MDWQSAVEDYFKTLGFEVDWIWLNRQVIFLLAWKGNDIQIYQVEREWSVRPAKPTTVKNSFIDLLGCLRRLSKWEKNFKGRDIVFKWMAFRDLSDEEKGVLQEAGVGLFFFKPDNHDPKIV